MAFPPIPHGDAVTESAERTIAGPWLRWFRSLSRGGTWTPTDASGAALSFTNTTGNCGYARFGRLVTAWFRVTYPATVNGSNTLIGGLPFPSDNTTASVFGGPITSSDETTAARLLVTRDATTVAILTTAGAAVTNATMSGNDLRGWVTYTAAS